MGLLPLLVDLCIFLLEEIIAMYMLRLSPLSKSLSLGGPEDLQHTCIHDLDYEQSSSLLSPSHHHLP